MNQLNLVILEADFIPSTTLKQYWSGNQFVRQRQQTPFGAVF